MRTEPSPRWVRASSGGVPVVDSRGAWLFWEDHFPICHYAVPATDVRAELMPADPPPSDGFDFYGPQSPVTRWYDVRAGERVVEHGAWELADPALAGRVVLSWRPGGLDWTEEDEPVASHPRDPYHRVDALPSSRHVVVRVDGVTLAESDDPVLLFETGLPTRYYLPAEDVALRRLTPSETHSHCPYKGIADRYWSLSGLPDMAWSYSDPIPAARTVAGRVCFYNERVDIAVDGVDLARPRTPFS